jgi:hypothetical protein
MNNHPMTLTEADLATKKQILEALSLRIDTLNAHISEEVHALDGLREDIAKEQISIGRTSQILFDVTTKMETKIYNLIAHRKALEEAKCKIFYNFGF